jgi:hypothetical protein
MYRLGRSAIDIRNNTNVEVGHNEIYNYGNFTSHMGAIYGAQNSVTSSLNIHHNWIHDTNSYSVAGPAAGVYFQNASAPGVADVEDT